MRRIAKLLYAILKCHHSYREAVLFAKWCQASRERDLITERYLTRRSWSIGQLYEYNTDAALLVARRSNCVMRFMLGRRGLTVVTMAGSKEDVGEIFSAMFPEKKPEAEKECVGK